jgi:hypothetical protein
MDRFKAAGAAAASLATALLTCWWLLLVARRLGTRPVVENGAVVLDEFQRAKDILIVLLPLFSASVAYWIGNKGVEKAHEDAGAARAQLTAVLDQAPADVLTKAREKHPDSFR